eukprot:scaffold74172_cov61-Attheya_sp.AAC.1
MTESTNRDEWLAQIEKSTQIKAGDQWRKRRWWEYLQEVVWWLHNEESIHEEYTIDAAVGLIKYGIIHTKEDLQNISHVKKEFRDALTATLLLSSNSCPSPATACIPLTSSDVSERKSELVVFLFANASWNRYKIDLHSTTREIVQDTFARPGRLAKTRSLYAFKTSAKK